MSMGWYDPIIRKVDELAKKVWTQIMYDSSLNTKVSVGTSSITHSKKRALLCVVTNEENGRLRAGTDDVKSMRNLLMNKFGYLAHCIRVLTEFEPEEFRPTKNNIENALRWLVEGCQEGDELMFYFTGHCVRQSDSRNDKIKEGICPVDFKEEGMISDNDIDITIVRPLKPGVRLHAIVDACHSGTILDLEYIYDKKLNQWKDNRPPSGAPRNTGGGSAICLSACQDNQMEADTTASTRKTPLYGVLTCIFTEAIKQNPTVSYGQLLEILFAETGRHKSSEYAGACGFKISQKLMLSSSSPDQFNVNSPIFTVN